MLIKNVSTLLGKELDFISNTNIKIQDGRFKRIQPNIGSSAKEESFDCEGLLLIPGFVNCHTHIGDSIAKDITLNSSVDSRIHPVSGIKSKILKETNPKYLKNYMKNSCNSMLNKGITTFVDFREGGLEGILMLKEVLTKVPIRSIILGRLEFYQNNTEYYTS
jgi:cytosine/adenosine deaminase-related metal-dependent hydrolase